MRIIEKQLDDYIDYCENVLLQSPGTVNGKRWFKNDFLKNINCEKIEEIRTENIHEWISIMAKKGIKGVTINNKIVHLRTVINYFHNIGINTPYLQMVLINKVPEYPPRRQYYTEEQINEVLSLCKPFEWLLISLTYDCGFRISELRNLRLSNIDGQRISFIGKGRKDREVYISLETKKRLDAYIEYNHITDYLWIGERPKDKNTPITVEGIRQRMTRAFNRAGYYGFYPHALRHSFATNICNKGASMVEAQKMLGHAKIETTEVYVHSFDGRLKEYFNKYKFAVV